MLPLRVNFIRIVDVGPDEVLEPGVRVEAGAVLADLDQPLPDDVRRRVDRDRLGRPAQAPLGIRLSPGKDICLFDNSGSSVGHPRMDAHQVDRYQQHDKRKCDAKSRSARTTVFPYSFTSTIVVPPIARHVRYYAAPTTSSGGGNSSQCPEHQPCARDDPNRGEAATDQGDPQKLRPEQKEKKPDRPLAKRSTGVAASRRLGTIGSKICHVRILPARWAGIWHAPPAVHAAQCRGDPNDLQADQ